MPKEEMMEKKRFMTALAAIAIFTLTACASLQPAATPAAPAAEDGVTIRLPKWPLVAYTNEAQDAYLVLSVKDPKRVNIPAEMTLTNKGGEKIVFKLIQQEQPKAK
jgi:hypothetical protein